jgi:organic radical activating enzyme
LKLVYPQVDAPPTAFEHLAFQHFLLQPMDGPNLRANMQASVDYCMANPRWQLSLQTHKWLGID